MPTLAEPPTLLDADEQSALRLLERTRQRAAHALGRAPDNDALAASTVAIVLAGGRGTRLANLTDHRAKPAVFFGGAYRLIDFTLSNCVHSGIRRIGVCTQYKPQSLIDHLQRAWNFLDRRAGEFVEVMPAQHCLGENGYRGTADAVHRHIELLRGEAAQYVLVLAGDHIYKMDYRRMLADHAASGAEITVGCAEVPLARAGSFGVMQVDRRWRVTRFDEKPTRPLPIPGRPDCALASMGIYVFNAEVLYRALARDASAPVSSHDFGKDVIPELLRSGAHVVAHALSRSCVNHGRGQPYWRDVGTVDAFWEANLDLTHDAASLDLYDRHWPILSAPLMLPPARFLFEDGQCGRLVNSLVAGGCVVRGATIRCSLLSNNVTVNDHTVIEESVILPDVEIGRHCVIRRAVIDKRCRLPDGFVVGVDAEADRRRFHVTERGVTLVTPDMLAAPEREAARAS